MKSQAWQRHRSGWHEELQGPEGGARHKWEMPAVLSIWGGCCTPQLPGTKCQGRPARAAGRRPRLLIAAGATLTCFSYFPQHPTPGFPSGFPKQGLYCKYKSCHLLNTFISTRHKLNNSPSLPIVLAPRQLCWYKLNAFCSYTNHSLLHSRYCTLLFSFIVISWILPYQPMSFF